MWAIQLISECESDAEATIRLTALKMQHDCLGGRVLPPGPGKPKIRVQVFFRDAGPDVRLPDGCTRVYMTSTVQKIVGLEVAA